MLSHKRYNNKLTTSCLIKYVIEFQMAKTRKFVGNREGFKKMLSVFGVEPIIF